MQKSTMLAGYALACSLLVGNYAVAQTVNPAKAPVVSSETTAAPAADPMKSGKEKQLASTAPVGKVDDGMIHGNKKSRTYHLATCPSYGKLSEKNIVSFATEDEAMKAGYQKAKNCK